MITQNKSQISFEYLLLLVVVTTAVVIFSLNTLQPRLRTIWENTADNMVENVEENTKFRYW